MKAVFHARQGDMEAIKFIKESLDGKTPQPIANDEDHPVVAPTIIFQVVKAHE